MDDKIKCVYKLKCRDTNITEFYIGSSMNFKQRKRGHNYHCNNVNCRVYCSPVYMFINVNGGFDNWMFEIIKEYNLISKKELIIEEQKWIELLQPHLNGQNAKGINKEPIKKRNRIRNKIRNKIKANCPHCGEEMLKRSIKRHIGRWHEV